MNVADNLIDIYELNDDLIFNDTINSTGFIN